MKANKPKRRRCAIYTRKSTETGLEQDFNSLDAQREACEAYIKSQVHEGWKLLPDLYDDGGLSGGTLDRPALQRLLDDVKAGRIDVIVVYKVDRLTRALTDFAKLVDLFDRHGVSFVSVTQQFNTTTSMGRLTLNVLLSFAQFEREVISERIRDKVAQSKARGIWMGGPVPLGYDLGERELLVNKVEAEQVREIFELYLEMGSVRALKTELDRRGFTTKVRHQKNGRTSGGGPFSRGHLYCLLSNPIYIGKLPHRGKLHEGKQKAIIDQDLWDNVQDQLKLNKRGTERPGAKHPSLLAGKLELANGQKLAPSHSVKKGRRYRYYIERWLIQDDGVGTKGARFAAVEVEKAVVTILQRYLNDPSEIIALFEKVGRTPAAFKNAITKAKSFATDLRDHHKAGQTIGGLIHKVVIQKGALEVHIRTGNLAISLGVEPSPEKPIHAMTFPCRLAKRGQDLKFILPLLEDSDSFSLRDPALIQAVAKAHQWWHQIKSGQVQSLSEISRHEKMDKPKVTRWLRLAFLSPNLVRQIRDGTQPPALTVKKLTRDLELPLSWQDQENLIAKFG